MHVLFVHRNFPAQFGHVAAYLVRNAGYQCTFLSEGPPGETDGVCRLQYKLRGGATAKTHYCSRSFENYTWHSHAVYETMKAHPEIRPDLVVGHSGFGSTVFLADLYDCPIINYFEYYYHARGADIDFRPELPGRELDILRCRTRNSAILTDLQTCAVGYCPTEWQRSLFPAEYQPKLRTIFDGIDTAFWCPPAGPRQQPVVILGRTIPARTRIVTYVSRGFESMRGFDIFMKAAKRLCDLRPDVVFVCVGSDKIQYGGDERFTGGRSFREHVLAGDKYDLDRFFFTGSLPPGQLLSILQMSDLHIYLTVPFVLSWSLMNALACGCTVLASDTAPVREVVSAGQNGLLSGFHDVDGFVCQAMPVLDDRPSFIPWGSGPARPSTSVTRGGPAAENA